MKIDFQVGPDLQQVLLAGDLEHAVEQDQHPGRHARQAGDVLLDGLVDDGVQFGLPLAHQGRLLAGGAADVRPEGHVFYDDGREVPEIGVVVLVNRRASSQPQSLALEDLGILVVVDVQAEHVLSGLEMAVIEGLVAHRDELALGIGGSTGFGEPLDLARPEDVLLSPPVPLDQRLYGLVLPYGHPLCKDLVALYAPKIILPPDGGAPGLRKQVVQNLLLDFYRMLHEEVDLVLPLLQDPGDDRMK